jgi:hypothetical protein
MPDLSKSKFQTESKTITSTSADASADLLYTCPNNYSAIVRYLNLSNGTANNKKAYIQFYHQDDTTYHYIANGIAMGANTTKNLLDGNYFNLHQGDKILAYIESGMTLDVTISVEEYYNPTRGTI